MPTTLIMPFLALQLFLALLQPAQVEGAAVPDAEQIRVDRGLQVVVLPNRLRLQYDLGLSPPAATALLQRNSREIPAGDDRRALMEAVRDVAIAEIQNRCRIKADGVPLTVQPLESSLFPKHYVQLSCLFEAPLPAASGPIRLQMADGSFRGYDGDHLIALKTGDGVQLKSSTVPLILARVPRQSVSRDSAAQDEAARRAEAVVQVVQVDRDPIHAVAEKYDPPNDEPPLTEASESNPSASEQRASESRPSAQPSWTTFVWLTACVAGILTMIAFWRLRSW